MNRNRQSLLKTLLQRINFGDVLNIISLGLDLINLSENKKQTSNDEIMEMLQKQNKEYLEILISERNGQNEL